MQKRKQLLDRWGQEKDRAEAAFNTYADHYKKYLFWTRQCRRTEKELEATPCDR